MLSGSGKPRILVLNPGSSTLKASVVQPPSRTAVASTTIEWDVSPARGSGRPARGAAVDRAMRRLADGGVAPESITGVGYRVVHGGTRFVEPTLIDDEVVAVIRDLADLAPLHNAIAAETIEAGRGALPAIPHVAVFDTAFHASLSAAAFRYPVPERWFTEWGIRRFGFHGISVAWSVRRSAELLGRPAGELRLVIAHLGAGCSVTATDGGQSVDTSMGYTPLEGLMMATRSGSIDPGIVLRLLRQGHVSLAELENELEHGSGLLGVSGRSSDVRDLVASESAGDEASALALEMFVRRAAAGVAGAASCLPGLDAIVFTGGIGEHAESVRKRIIERLAVLGVRQIRLVSDSEDGILTPVGHAPVVLRIAAREDLLVADAVAVLTGVEMRSDGAGPLTPLSP